MNILLHSDALAKVGFIEGILPATLDHWHHCQITNFQTSGGYFTTDEVSAWYPMQRWRPQNQIGYEEE